MSTVDVLEQAWRTREQGGWLERLGALRVFHGPGEGAGPWADVAIERFASEGGADYWVTSWGSGWHGLSEACASFLKSKGARSAVVVTRPEKGIASLAEPFLGAPPEIAWVREGAARFQIRFLNTRHPGLFLDHEPLRAWLLENSRGLKILNTFAYTGSLSAAAGLGGAGHVTTLDLSRPSIEWARLNWAGNSLEEARAKFLFGDVFEWLPRLKRAGERFDCVILDPPSFSRGKKASFSTSKDLPKLHREALGVLKDGGTLVSSINSANVSFSQFESDLREAAHSSGRALKLLHKITLPETFPAHTAQDRYLKGGIYSVTS